MHVDAKHARMEGESAVERLSNSAHVLEGRVIEFLQEILKSGRERLLPRNAPSFATAIVSCVWRMRMFRDDENENE